MDRRSFGAAASAGVVGLFLPRKTEAQEPIESLSHEQVAKIIFNHPKVVYLDGASSNGIVRYKMDSDSSPWSDWSGGDNIIIRNRKGREKFIVGSKIIVHYSRKSMTGHYLYKEEWYEISNPQTKMIHCVGDSDGLGELDGRDEANEGRYFVRAGERWIESS